MSKKTPVNTFQKIYKHRLVEDIISIAQAILVFSIGIYLFQKSNIVAGGTAGISLLISYVFGYNLSVVFFLFNLPFYFIALFSLGVNLFIRTLITVSLTSLLIDYLPSMIEIEVINRFIGSLFAGLFCGIGVLILLRHKSSLGGFTILVTIIQDKFNINGGKILLAIDTSIMLASLYLFDFETVIYSYIAVFMVKLYLYLTTNLADIRLYDNV